MSDSNGYKGWDDKNRRYDPMLSRLQYNYADSYQLINMF